MRPTDRELIRVLRRVALLLGNPPTFALGGRFFFVLGGGWALAISPDDAGRFRLGAFYGRREIATLWASTNDPGRLAALVLELRSEVSTLAA
jgi:hypothetical protein